MMRPSDQAKLLFLYLLRSSSALATRATTSTTTTTTATTTTSTTAVGNIGNVNVNVNVNMNANVNMNVAAASASGTMNSMNMNMNSMRDTFHSIGKSLNKVNANAKSKANANANAVNTNTSKKNTNNNNTNNNNTNPKNNMNPELQGHISLRLATRLDVPSIQRCNLASLPENYSSNFYVNHIRSFPDLALVAEHVPPGASSNGNGNNNSNNGGKRSNGSGRRNPFDNYNPSTPESQIIGYVLGKIEQVDNPEPPSKSTRKFTPSTISTGYDDLDDYLSYNNNNNNHNHNTPEMIGHVTSLAVLKPYRRNGLAALLMKQLHFHMQYGHSASGVGLHVRVSNIAARRLYCEGMGYGVVDVIRGYYADGEDAFFMKKKLLADNGNGNDEYTSFLESEQEVNTQKKSLGSRWSFRRKNNVNNGNVGGNGNAVYENGPLEFRLPMIIPLNNGNNNANANTNGNANGNSDDSVSSDADTNAIDAIPGMVDDSSEEEDAHVMTGSL
jgi:ribosomal protein S18 acetylase RimI-like enzyme